MILCGQYGSAPIAQLDRVLDFESKGWGFDPLWAHININNLQSIKRYPLLCKSLIIGIASYSFGFLMRLSVNPWAVTIHDAPRSLTPGYLHRKSVPRPLTHRVP